MSTHAATGGRAPAALSREEVRERCGAALAALTFTAGALAWWYYGTAPFMDGVLFFTAVGVTLAGLLAYVASGHSAGLAGAMITAVGTAAAAVAVWHTRAAVAGFLFLGPLLAVAMLLRPPLAVAYAALAAPFLWLTLGRPGFLPAAALLLQGMALWLAFAALDDLLGRLSRRSQDAVYLAEELRDQRGRLNRAIKDLDQSYQWLQQTNRELALSRREADELREMRSRFATNLSHELRTPLNIILGFSQLIYLNPELYGYASWSPLLLHDLSEVQRNAGYLSQLVSDIVDLARVDAMAMPIRKQPAQLGPVLEQAVATVASMARDKGLAVRVSCPEGLPSMQMDPMRIGQVLFNLVTNAIRYTEAGSIEVSARAAGEEVIVSVADTGRGIAPGDLETIFNEYYQVGRPKEGADAGKGLGLAIARRFVQLHGGRIWAESEVGRGSTFSFALPLGPKSVGLLRRAGDAPLPKPALRPSVLVLDEDSTASGYLARRLEGCDFLAVASLEEMGQALVSHRPLAVITGDAPGVGPEPDAALAAKLPPQAPWIRCSLPSTRWLAPDHQFAAMLSKPVSTEQLLEAARRVLPRLGGARVLVVDDDRGFAQLVARVLASALEGAPETQVAYGGEEALRRASRFRPDLMLMDLVMPDLSGFEVVERLRADPALAEVPVIALSAATPGEDQLAASGASFALHKREPFQPGELAALLGAALGLPAAAPDGVV